MKIEELTQTTIQRQLKNGYKEDQVRQAWIMAKNYGDFETILFKSSNESFKGSSNFEISEKIKNDKTSQSITIKFIALDKTPNKDVEYEEDEQELQKAIEESKKHQENQKYAVEQGIRKSGQPVGLQNLGSTCYFNSLIQTYFFNENFIKTLLSLELPDDRSQLSNNICQAILFVESLQLLFVKMYCSNEFNVDPEEVISFMSNYEGLKLNFYEQQDLAEFNHVMLQKIEIAILQKEQSTQQSENDSQNPFSIIKNTYFGKLNCKILADKQIQEQYYEDFNFIQIDVTSNNLIKGLENFLDSKIENYKNKTQQIVEGCKKCLFSQLPEVLSFQIQRVKFSAVQQNTTKDSRQFFFDQELDVQQFCSEELFFDEQEEEDQDDDFNFSTILNHLEGAHQFFSIQGSDQKKLKKFQLNSNKNVSYIQEMLTDSIEQIKGKIQQQEQLQIKKQQLLKNQEQICTKYVLQSIIIHQGTAQHGHYFSYIKDFYLNKWFKFNDFKVEEVSEENVLLVAQGYEKIHESSTYLILYLNESQVKKEKQSTIPLRLFNTSKNKDFLNDVYGQFIKQKQKTNLDLVLKENLTVKQIVQKSEIEIQDFPLQKIVYQYQKNYDIIINQYKQFAEKCQKKLALQSIPPFYKFSLYYYYYENYHNNVKWLCVDLAIKQQFSKQYGIFDGTLVSQTIHKQIVAEVYQNSYNSEKYLIKYLPEKSHYQTWTKNHQNTIKCSYISCEVLKLYQTNQNIECLGALQALVKFARSINVENFGFGLAVQLRFFIPHQILVHILDEYETGFNEDIFHIIMAFDKQGFFEYKNQEYQNYSCQTTITQFNNRTSKYRRLPILVDKSNQDTLQFLENEKEAFDERIKAPIDKLYEKYDPKDLQLDKVDDTFYNEFLKELRKFVRF